MRISDASANYERSFGEYPSGDTSSGDIGMQVSAGQPRSSEVDRSVGNGSMNESVKNATCNMNNASTITESSQSMKNSSLQDTLIMSDANRSANNSRSAVVNRSVNKQEANSSQGPVNGSEHHASSEGEDMNDLSHHTENGDLTAKTVMQSCLDQLSNVQNDSLRDDAVQLKSCLKKPREVFQQNDSEKAMSELPEKGAVVTFEGYVHQDTPMHFGAPYNQGKRGPILTQPRFEPEALPNLGAMLFGGQDDLDLSAELQLGAEDLQQFDEEFSDLGEIDNTLTDDLAHESPSLRESQDSYRESLASSIGSHQDMDGSYPGPRSEAVGHRSEGRTPAEGQMSDERPITVQSKCKLIKSTLIPRVLRDP